MPSWLCIFSPDAFLVGDRYDNLSLLGLPSQSFFFLQHSSLTAAGEVSHFHVPHQTLSACYFSQRPYFPHTKLRLMFEFSSSNAMSVGRAFIKFTKLWPVTHGTHRHRILSGVCAHWKRIQWTLEPLNCTLQLCNETVIDALKPSWVQAANYSSNLTHIHTQSTSSNDKGESSLSNLAVQVAVYYTRSQIMCLIIKEKSCSQLIIKQQATGLSNLLLNSACIN